MTGDELFKAISWIGTHC